MALQTALEFIENPNPKFIEAVEETARLAVSGTGWTLSLYPAAAVAAFLGIFTIAPLFTNISFTQVFNSFLARLARRSDYYYDYQIRNLQDQLVQLHRKGDVLKSQVEFYNDYNNYGLSGETNKYYGVANAGATSGSASRL